jgi:hypothetical protein
METQCIMAATQIQQQAAQAGCGSQFNDVINCFSGDEAAACTSRCSTQSPGGTTTCTSPCEAQTTALNKCAGTHLP